MLGDTVGPCPVVGLADGTPSRTSSRDEVPGRNEPTVPARGRSPQAEPHRSLAIGPLACRVGAPWSTMAIKVPSCGNAADRPALAEPERAVRRARAWSCPERPRVIAAAVRTLSVRAVAAGESVQS
ncbi:hypothetical protein Sgleb_75060 [Streptomyces glebosus]|uniref:Uncharacterized protein n=1 Tax=Streptomyces glebosus TaxID=249580 RepID=A0A640T6U3_9ACTN|nr:hypothetical protein Sgleb_75060 [Streptomyces glebosus]